MISVIIPVYNDSENLQKCLTALKNQSINVDLFEVLVIDNNSEEDILHVVEKFGDRNVKYLKEEKIGSYAARNLGIANSQGEIIAFTDSDCIPKNDWLEKGTACLKYATMPGVVGGRIQLTFRGERPNYPEIYEKHTAFRQKENLATGTCVGANWFSYKSVLNQFGGFNSKLKSGGDTELSGLISHHGYKAIYCEEAVIFHPARHSFKALGIKYARLYGGRFDRCKSNKLRFSIFYFLRFIFRRTRWNLKLIFKGYLKDSFAIFIVNLYIYYKLFNEVIQLNRGKLSSRA